MSWSNVKMSDVQVSNFTELPEGDFVFQIVPGASYRDRGGSQELSVQAVVVEGESKGRRTFLNFPDPESVSQNGKPKAWSAQQLKKLQLALGVDAEDGEDPVAYFHRPEVLNSQFTMTRARGNYIPNGATEAKIENKLFSVRPAVINASA